MIVTQREREREREAETQAEGEAGSMHREPDMEFDPGAPGSHPGPKAGAKPLHHPGIPEVLLWDKSCTALGNHDVHLIILVKSEWSSAIIKEGGSLSVLGSKELGF